MDDVAKVVASKLGPGYPVKPAHSDNAFLVGRGIFRARIKVLTGDQTTRIQLWPTGLSVLRIVNYVWLVRKVRTALQQSELK
jgi:hypothetical protein